MSTRDELTERLDKLQREYSAELRRERLYDWNTISHLKSEILIIQRLLENVVDRDDEAGRLDREWRSRKARMSRYDWQFLSMRLPTLEGSLYRIRQRFGR